MCDIDPVAVAGALLAGWDSGPLPEDPDRIEDLPALGLPRMPGPQLRTTRAGLRQHSRSPLERAEVMALLQHAPRLSELISLNYHRGLMLELASRMSMRGAIRLARAWPPIGSRGLAVRRGAEADELELFAEELGCLGDSLSPWVEKETLDRSAGGDPVVHRRRMNAMRWLRLHEVIANVWIAETMFPRVEKPAAGTLVWTVGPPLVVDRLRELTPVDVCLSVEDLEARTAAQRRQAAAGRVRSALRQGLRIAMIANHTTVSSREALLEVAREEGAASEAWYFDVSEAEVERRNAEAGWPAPARTVERVLEQLEAPRPHEAEEVFVVGDDGPIARWAPAEGLLDGFVESPM